MSEEIESRERKKFPHEFNRTKSRILGALPKLDTFLNAQVRVQSGTDLGTSQNMIAKNQEPTGDRSQNDPRPEVDASIYRLTQSMDSDPEETSYSHFSQALYL